MFQGYSHIEQLNTYSHMLRERYEFNRDASKCRDMRSDMVL